MDAPTRHRPHCRADTGTCVLARPGDRRPPFRLTRRICATCSPSPHPRKGSDYLGIEIERKFRRAFPRFRRCGACSCGAAFHRSQGLGDMLHSLASFFLRTNCLLSLPRITPSFFLQVNTLFYLIKFEHRSEPKVRRHPRHFHHQTKTCQTKTCYFGWI
jgi:hypothetical protein